MNEYFQFGQHPNADLLSAFAEQALPPHEQQRMLSHLAQCAECRGIVYLAQECALEDFPAPQAIERPAEVRKPWFTGGFTGWRIAWPAAAVAVGCLLIVVIQLRLRSVPKAENSTAIIASNAQAPKVTEGIPQAPARQVVKSTSALPLQSKSSAPPLSISMASETPPKLLQSEQIDSATLTGRNAAELIRMQPAPTASAQNSATAGGQMKPISGKDAPRPASETVTVVSGSESAMAMDTTVVHATISMTQVEAAGLTQPAIKLPSHLATVSTISQAKLMLAIDAMGTLFASKDAGKHWKEIKPQWTGRAVRVELASTSKRKIETQPTAGYQAAKAAPAPAVVLDSNIPVAPNLGNATIAGVVMDPTGAVIPGAAVTATNTATGSQRATITNGMGQYGILQLVPGEYTLHVSARGFAAWQKSGITVSVSEPTLENIALHIGGDTAAVTVVSGADAEVPVDSAQISGTIKDEKTAVALPEVFELTTDTGAVWASTDGRHWARK
jgi:hypothetical protein